MLSHFFRHYDSLVDHYFIYDNGSTDDSLDLLAKHDRVTTFHFETTGDSFVAEECRLGDTIWKGSEADWVIITDIDEHIYRPDLLPYLKECTEAGVTAIQSIGYEMVSEEFPRGKRPLSQAVTIGARSTGHDRLCIFNPKQITETHFDPGRHTARPQGNVVWPDYPQLLLLHFKQLGSRYVIGRSAELRRGLRSRDLSQGWGKQYTWSSQAIIDNWEKLRAQCVPVPGLGDLAHVPPERYCEEERIVKLSGLVDDAWYLAAHPDVQTAEMSPSLHFCIYGWKEGRWPNFYFDTYWYTEAHPELDRAGLNPLYDYIVRGEKQDEWPSPHFHTGWYRAAYGIPREQSPLLHYLSNRSKGRVSPVPDFDVVSYCQDHPEATAPGNDPFEHSQKQDAPTVVA
jgi:hypothetical protein